MEDDRLSIIKTWKNKIEGIEMLRREIENYSMNYDCIENEEFFAIAYEYLNEKKEFEGIEYRFLCWLNHKYSWTVKINLPNLITPINIEQKAFQKDYITSEKRKELFEILNGFLYYVKTIANVNTLSILIGGSFTDDNSTPNDLDCVILLNEDYLDNYKLSENYLRSVNAIPDGIDVHFLPINYSIDFFKAYSHIMYLGNNAQKKDGTLINNNEFKEREIIRIDA